MQNPYEYYNNTILCVRANFLFDEAKIISYDNYKKLAKRGGLNVVRNARGKFNYALVEFKTMREDIKRKLVSIVKPSIIRESMLNKYIKPDVEAAKFFVDYTDESGNHLKRSLQKKYLVNVIVLKAVQALHDELMVNIYTSGGKKSSVYKTIENELDKVDTEQYSHSLPSSWKGIKRNLDSFNKSKYASVIHGNHSNTNTLKIKGDVANWIIAQFSLPTKPSIVEVVELYDIERRSHKWPKITEQAVNIWLNRPENRRLWYLGRHGEEAYKNEYQHKLTIDKSKWFPNVMWAIDGSKLDWIHYEDNKRGWAAKLKIEPVVDVYSEKIIGWSMSETEDFATKIEALKMACNNAGVKPYIIQYDNQGGHKKDRMQRLYTDIVAKDGGSHYPNKAYSHSNPMEQIFGRLQKQVLNKVWFSDKQSIKSKKMDSLPNMDFIMENKHLLKTKEELSKLFALLVEEWNEDEHPRFKGQSRNEVYQHEMTKQEQFDIEELSTMFWVGESQRPITYTNTGLVMRPKGVRYEYEVYDKDGKVDLDFRNKHIGSKFIVRYDPEYLNDFVKLYYFDSKTKEERFETIAQSKRKHTNIPILHDEESKSIWYQDNQVKELELNRDKKRLKLIRNQAGVSPEQSIEDTELMIKMGGKLPKEIRNVSESEISFLDSISKT